eukprot:6202612-Pleurochrysis_carterae.AAC.3
MRIIRNSVVGSGREKGCQVEDRRHGHAMVELASAKSGPVEDEALELQHQQLRRLRQLSALHRRTLPASLASPVVEHLAANILLQRADHRVVLLDVERQVTERLFMRPAVAAV